MVSRVTRTPCRNCYSPRKRSEYTVNLLKEVYFNIIMHNFFNYLITLHNKGLWKILSDPCNFVAHPSQRNEDSPQSWHHTQALLTAQNMHTAVNVDTRLGLTSAHTSDAFVFRCVCVPASESCSCKLSRIIMYKINYSRRYR